MVSQYLWLNYIKCVADTGSNTELGARTGHFRGITCQTNLAGTTIPLKSLICLNIAQRWDIMFKKNRKRIENSPVPNLLSSTDLPLYKVLSENIKLPVWKKEALKVGKKKIYRWLSPVPQVQHSCFCQHSPDKATFVAQHVRDDPFAPSKTGLCIWFFYAPSLLPEGHVL